MAVVDEEQFGPVLPVIGYDSLDDTVGRINASMFGLCASVWGEDGARATDVATRIECGTAWVNTHAANAPHQQFGGFKWSGVGLENGVPGLASFTETQVVHRRRSV